MTIQSMTILQFIWSIFLLLDIYVFNFDSELILRWITLSTFLKIFSEHGLTEAKHMNDLKILDTLLNCF